MAYQDSWDPSAAHMAKREAGRLAGEHGELSLRSAGQLQAASVGAGGNAPGLWPAAGSKEQRSGAGGEERGEGPRLETSPRPATRGACLCSKTPGPLGSGEVP